MRLFLVHGRGCCLRHNVLFTSKQKKESAEKVALAFKLAEEATPGRVLNDSWNLSGQSSLTLGAENIKSSDIAQGPGISREAGC